MVMGGALVSIATSCDDMLDKGNDYVIDANDKWINNAADTATYVLGIINKLQAIAVRTNLFGELRGDLVTVNSNATSDLKEIASYDVSDDNAYNVPRDYYAVINNCNYYLARVDSTAGNANRNEQYFVREIAQVHSIRAWVYLQLALVYGRVPLVTEPILTASQSNQSYPMYDLPAICDYFINDLQSYYATEYPDYQTVGGDIDPMLCFFPTQVVMGDLYLWRAVTSQDKESAKNAAKCYYDYITWDLSGKSNLYTTANRWYWSENAIYTGLFKAPSDNVSSSSVWGSDNCDDITMIPMDSASADGYYNELRNLYNTTNVLDVVQASIKPSDYLIELNELQSYVGYDTYKNVVEVNDKIEGDDDAIENHLLGDLRFQKDYQKKTQQRGTSTEEYDEQTIKKHSSQHISIYRSSQLYLKLAEALNYAGYPRFARQILTMGLNNSVIEYEVSPFYVASGDSAFIAYFQFDTNSFVPYATNYSQTTNEYGVVLSTSPVLRADESDCNMWGIHSRGSGLAFLNDKYAPLAVADSTAYPYALEEAIPAKPAEAPLPSPWETLTYDEWAASRNRPTESGYNSYVTAHEDSVANYLQYVEDLGKYDVAVDAYLDAYKIWYEAAYSDASFITKEQKMVDEYILDEQALEMSYEGNRYYDVMRRAYWWNDASYMTSMQNENSNKLATRSNWFLSWDGQIGLEPETQPSGD